MALGGGVALAASLAAPGLVLASGAARRFELVREGDVIGTHSLSVAEQGDAVIMTINIDISVRVLGIRVYAYEHENRETWRGGRLVSLESRTNDDGDNAFARVTAKGDALSIAGSSFEGMAPAEIAKVADCPARTLDARPWFSSQSGEVLSLKFDQRTTPKGIECALSGDVATTLIYDSEKEWRGCRFAARGSDVVYRQTAPGPRFGPLL